MIDGIECIFCQAPCEVAIRSNKKTHNSSYVVMARVECTECGAKGSWAKTKDPNLTLAGLIGRAHSLWDTAVDPS